MCVRFVNNWDLYNNVTSVCIFICCWPWSIKGHVHRWRQIHVRSRQQICFSFFMPPKFFNKLSEFLLYKTNRLHFSLCVYCNRSQTTSQRVKNNSHATRLRLVSYFFCSLHAVTSFVIYYSTHTRKNVIYLLDTSLKYSTLNLYLSIINQTNTCIWDRHWLAYDYDYKFT